MKAILVEQFLHRALEPLEGAGADHGDVRGQLTPAMFLRQMMQQLAAAAADAQQHMHSAGDLRDQLREAADDLQHHQKELHSLTVALDSASHGELGFVAQNDMRRGHDIMRSARFALRRHRGVIEEAKKKGASRGGAQQKQLEEANQWVTQVADVSAVVMIYYATDNNTKITTEQLEEAIDAAGEEVELSALSLPDRPRAVQERRKQRVERMQKVLQDLRSGHRTPAQLFHDLASTAPGSLPHGLAGGISVTALQGATQHLAHDLEHCHSHDDHKAAHDYIRKTVLPAVREARDKLREARQAKAERASEENTPSHDAHDHHDHHMEHLLTQVESHFESLLQGLGLGQQQHAGFALPPRK